MTHLFVVSDALGFVGAYLSEAEALGVTHEFRPIPFIVQRFPMSEKSTTPGSVWLVLYRDVDAVAYASADKDAAVAVQAAYRKVGLTYDEPIDHWETAVGKMHEQVEERLRSQRQAHVMYGGGDTTLADAFRELAKADAEVLALDDERREARRPPPPNYSILDAVVLCDDRDLSSTTPQ